MTHQLVLACLVVALASVAVPVAAQFAGLPASGWATMAAALGTGAATGFGLSRLFASRFDRIREAAALIERGDWSAGPFANRESRLIEGGDELAVLVDAMRQQLSRRFSQLDRIVEEVLGASRELGDAARGVADGNADVGAAVEHVASQLTGQREVLREAASALEALAAEVGSNTALAREASRFADEACEGASVGVETASHALEQIETVVERVESASQRACELEEKTRLVRDMTEIITEVAHRTNLLSLNASIEAARAGEAGRGFAVVADEIRKLSENAGRSAGEVAKLVHEIQADTGGVAEEMRQSGEVIRDGRQDVRAISACLSQIEQSVSVVGTRSEAICRGGDQQVTSAETLVDSITELSKTAQSGAQAIRGVAQRMEVQLERVSVVSEASRTLEGLGARVRPNVGSGDADGVRPAGVEGGT